MKTNESAALFRLIHVALLINIGFLVLIAALKLNIEPATDIISMGRMGDTMFYP